MIKENFKLIIAESIGITKTNHCMLPKDGGRYYECYNCGLSVHFPHYNDSLNDVICSNTNDDYTEDLNAVNEIEKTLTDDERNKYITALIEECKSSDVFDLLTASAYNRIMAYVKIKKLAI